MFLALSLVFAVRLVQLTVVDAGKNADAAADSRTVSITLAPKRGTIYDRNGNVLASMRKPSTATRAMSRMQTGRPSR